MQLRQTENDELLNILYVIQMPAPPLFPPTGLPFVLCVTFSAIRARVSILTCTHTSDSVSFSQAPMAASLPRPPLPPPSRPLRPPE
jgi:hypothetical protein